MYIDFSSYSNTLTKKEEPNNYQFTSTRRNEKQVKLLIALMEKGKIDHSKVKAIKWSSRELLP